MNSPNHIPIFKERLNISIVKITICCVKKCKILSETKAKGMTISFLKHINLPMSSCHLYGSLKLFHSLLIGNQNYHKLVPNYNLPHIFSYADLIFVCFVLSILIIINFSRHQSVCKFKACWRVYSNVHVSFLNQYQTMSYHQHNTQIELNPQ